MGAVLIASHALVLRYVWQHKSRSVAMGDNAAFHIPWFDSLAALLAIPILIKEGKLAWKGQGCACC